MAGLRVDAKSMEPLIDVSFAHKVALIASALGTPPQWLVDKAHAHGIPVAALAGRIDHAVAHKEGGVDLIIAQGTEGGGHTGEIATMVLVPQVVDAVAPIPVLAAGGIASGRQMAAALALGAEGVWCGSVWLTTHEAEISPAIREKFLAATSADTRRSRSLTGKPARMLRSAWTDAWDEPDAPAPLSGPQNRFNDVAEDLQYQYVTDEHQITVAGTHIHESQTLDASYATGASANPSDNLSTSRLWATYYYRRRLGGTVEYFSTTGSTDGGLYPATAPGDPGVVTSASGSPDTRGWMAEVNYLPWLNVKLAAQYTWYSKFNGGGTNYDGVGRNASGNNALYLLLWIAY
jgi:hypothetical protein